jgi:hypothetical protein
MKKIKVSFPVMGNMRRKPYMNPRLKLIAIDIFSLNFILSFQMKIHGSSAK